MFIDFTLEKWYVIYMTLRLLWVKVLNLAWWEMQLAKNMFIASTFKFLPNVYFWPWKNCLKLEVHICHSKVVHMQCPSVLTQWSYCLLWFCLMYNAEMMRQSGLGGKIASPTDRNFRKLTDRSRFALPS